MYAHEELIEELGLTTDELAPSLRTKLRNFNNKKRLSSKPESIEKLNQDSEILADEIAEWYAEQNEIDDSENEQALGSNLTSVNDVEFEKKEPIVEKTSNIVSHVSNNEEEEKKEEIIEEKTSGFGLGFLGKW